MKICVGSKNEVKVGAVREMVSDYPLLRGAEIMGVGAPSDISGQPKSLEETIRGAKNRALNSFEDCDYSFGVEGGFMAAPHTKTGFMEFQACAIYDGTNFHIGLSSAFECPPEAMRLIFREGVELNEAVHRIGITSDQKIGSAEGTIGVLTKGRLTRKELTKEAIRTALIHLENPHLYT